MKNKTPTDREEGGGFCGWMARGQVNLGVAPRTHEFKKSSEIRFRQGDFVGSHPRPGITLAPIESELNSRFLF
jgi:hypothetical protein